MTFGSLFAGIGGLDLGLERAGMVCKWQVEIDPFCCKVLAKHWPEVPRYGDITKLTGIELEPVDLICGGFPCQDVSLAGLRKGIGSGTRSGLYADMLRIVCAIRPRFVLMENVPGLLVPRNADEPAPISRVLGDLAESGYDAEWDCIPASFFGLPHRRCRIFIVSYPNKGMREGLWVFNQVDVQELVSGQASAGASPLLCCLRDDVQTDRYSLRRDDGFSESLDRIAALGNAVVPQVAEWIGRRIMESVNG